MKILDLLRMSSSSLWKRKIRSVLTILGVVIGTASIVVMISLGLGLNKSTMQQIEENGGLTTINVYENNGGSYYSGGGMAEVVSDSSGSGKSDDVKRLDDDAVLAISELPNVNMVSPVLEINALTKYGNYQNHLSVRGMTVSSLEKMGIPLAEGTLPVPGDEKLKFLYGNMVIRSFYNEKTGEELWTSEKANDLDLMKNPLFVIFDVDAYYQSMNSSDNTTTTPPPKKYVIEACGIVAGGEEDYNMHSWTTYCDIEALKVQLKHIFKNKAIPGQPTTKTGKPFKDLYYNSIYVSVDSMDHVKEVQSAISAMGYQASSNSEWVESMQKQYGYIQAVLGGIGAVSLLVAAIGITNTMMMSIYERTKEIGIMKVLGCDLRNIQSLFLLEAAFIGFIGGMVGLLLSYGISAIINKVAVSMGYEMTLSYIPAWLAIVSVAFAVLVGMVAGFFPSLRAMKLSPLAAIRNE